MSANDIHQATAICKRALDQLSKGNSAECDAILAGHGQQIARALIMAHDMLWAPPHIKNYNS